MVRSSLLNIRTNRTLPTLDIAIALLMLQYAHVKIMRKNRFNLARRKYRWVFWKTQKRKNTGERSSVLATESGRTTKTGKENEYFVYAINTLKSFSSGFLEFVVGNLEAK